MNSTKAVCLPFFFLQPAIFTTSFVYNVRIAESTKQFGPTTLPNKIGITVIEQHTTRHDNKTENSVGPLCSYFYIQERWYAALDLAFAHIHNTTAPQKPPSVQTDDILLTLAWTGELSKQQLNISVVTMAGIPTHSNKLFLQPQCGSGTFSFGLQTDGYYKYQQDEARSLENAFAWAVRFVHFFPRSTTLKENTLPVCCNFTAGNVVDILVSHNTQWGKHSVEVGYDLTLSFGAKIYPAHAEITRELHGQSSGFYGSYSYDIDLGSRTTSLGVGLAYGFDHASQAYNTKRAITAWLSWSIGF